MKTATTTHDEIVSELEKTLKQLNAALDIIANTDGDYTQNIVNEALYAVGYYFDSDDEE